MADTVVQKLPTGDYLTTNWIQNTGSSAKYTYVDDTIGANDGDTTYVYKYAVSGGSNILFSYDAFTLPSNARNISLTIYMIAKRDSTNATPNVAGSIQIDSTVYTGTYQATTSDYAEYTTTWTTDPSTSAAWTYSGINGIDYFGAYGERAGNFSTGYSGTRITQVYAEVTYNFKAPYAVCGPGIVVGYESTSVG